MRLVSYQPQYFPRLHYFARILNSDIFAVADYVQFVRHHAYVHDDLRERGPSYQAHTPIKAQSGVQILDIPTRRGQLAINETQLAFPNPKERLKNFRVIAQQYRTATHAKSVLPILEAFFKKPHATVADINTGSILLALAMLLEMPDPLNADTSSVEDSLRRSEFRLRRIVPFSRTPIQPSEKNQGRDANQWLVDACKHFGATEYYYGGTAASAYMDFTPFKDAGIVLVQQSWRGETYPQLYGDFVPNLSIIDLLMNASSSEAREAVFTKEA